MGQCGTMQGGRHRKGRRGKKTRKGGAGYGFGGPITVGGLEVVPTSTSTPMKPDGTVDTKFAAADTMTNATVGGRRRKSRKGKSKKSRKGRSRKMRGGAGQYNTGAVRAEFTGNTSGTGPFTYGTYASAPAKVGGYGPTAGPDGVMPLA